VAVTPESLRQVEDLLAGAVSISATNRAVLVERLRSHIRGRDHEEFIGGSMTWHPDDVFLKTNGHTYYLWRAVGHEGGVLGPRHTKSGPQDCAQVSERAMKRHGRPSWASAQ
jgi:putative transposase